MSGENIQITDTSSAVRYIDGIKRELDAERALAGALGEALKRYGVHRQECRRLYPSGGGCTCGLDEALAKAARA